MKESFVNNRSICQQIECPYFGNHNSKCHYYINSSECHLLSVIPNLIADCKEDVLISKSSENNIQGIKNENRHFFIENGKYSYDLKFQQDYPDIFEYATFVVKEVY